MNKQKPSLEELENGIKNLSVIELTILIRLLKKAPYTLIFIGLIIYVLFFTELDLFIKILITIILSAITIAIINLKK